MSETTTEQIQEKEEAVDNRIDIFMMLHTFFRAFRKLWWLCLVLGFLLAALNFKKTAMTFTPMYQSEASFTVTTATTTQAASTTYSFYYDNSTAAQMAATFPYILESDLLTDLIKADLGVNQINGSITASAVSDSNLFTLTVTSTDPQDAYDILEAVINHYGEVSDYVIGETQLNMIQEPEVPTSAYNTRGGLHASMKGGAAGIVLALVLIFLLSQMRRTIRKEDEIKDVLNVTCVGTIPKVIFKKHRKKIDRDLSINNKILGDGFRESLRGIAMRLDKSMKEKHQKVILVTSTVQKEGVTTMATNVAYALAELGRSVVLMDGKVMRAAEDFTPDTDQENGLEDALYDVCYFTDALKPDKTGRIETLTCRRGLTRRRMLGSSEKFDRLFYKLSHERDYIVVDAPSCSRMEELTFMAENADCILYVIKQDDQRTLKIAESIQEISGYGAVFAGCILNQVADNYGSYGGYGKYGKYGNYSYRKYGYGRHKYGYGYGYGSHYGGDHYGGKRYGGSHYGGSHYGGGHYGGGHYGSHYGDDTSEMRTTDPKKWSEQQAQRKAAQQTGQAGQNPQHTEQNLHQTEQQ